MTMPDLWTFLSAPPVDLLGWTLLHFVWQGALVAVLMAGALWILRDHFPRARYAVSLAALVGLLALPVVTGVLLSENVRTDRPEAALAVAGETPVAVVPGPSGTGAGAAGTESVSSWRGRVAGWLHPALPWAVLAWGVGVVACAARWAGGAWRVRRLCRVSTPAPTGWRERLARLADRMGLQESVVLRQSDCIEGPMVSGWWRPVILVPAGLLSGLPPRQVEALLLHELAHVRRHDVLVGHLQALVETLLFFHPATWWISRKVRQTREACCDDLAVQGGAERTAVARALAALAERAVEGRAAAWAPAASGGSLLTRVRRLLSPEQAPSTHTQRLSMAAALLLVVGVPLGLAACASQQSTTEAEPTAEVAAAPGEDSVEGEDEVVVIRTDSTERTIRLGTGGPVEGDSLGEGAYVLRYDSRTDTLDLPRTPDLPDVGALTPPPLPFDPDSLERALRRQINPDSLARALQARINPDSLERALRMRINPDSLERRALKMRLRADSLAHRHREHADSLRRQLEQMRERWERSDQVLPGVRMRREMPGRLREQARRPPDSRRGRPSGWRSGPERWRPQSRRPTRRRPPLAADRRP